MRRLMLPSHLGALFTCPAEDTEKAQSAAAHKLLSDCLPLYTEERRIVLTDPPSLFCSEMGKPAFRNLPQVHFNLTHCNGLAACLLSHKECGVDAERVRPLREPVVRRVFSPGEQAALRVADDPDLLFTRLWTLKEAYVKAIGIGISYPMREVSFTLCGDAITCTKEDAVFWQTVEEGFVVSVCVLQ